MMSQPDSAIAIGKEIIKLSEKTGIYLAKMRGCNITGMSYWVKGDFNKGLEYMRQMVATAKKYNDSNEIARAYGNIAVIYIDMGDRNLGLDYSKKAIMLYNKIGEDKSTVHYLNNIGWIYEDKEMYDSALIYYIRAFDGFRKYYNNTEWLGQTLGNISSLYTKLAQPDSAMKYARQALAACRAFNNQKVLGHCYMSMSEALLHTGQYHSAISYADSALQIAKTKNIHTLTAEAYGLKYMGYEKIGKYKHAFENLKLKHTWTDSLLNEETNLELAAVKTQLATEKKDKEIAEKETQLAVSKAASQRNLYYLVIAVLVAVFTGVIAYQLYNRQQLRINAKNKQLEVEQQQKELVELQLKNEELKNEELNKELLSFTLTTAQKNQLLQKINDELHNITQAEVAQLRKVKHVINSAMGTEEDWEEFKIRFEQVHHSFFDNFKKDYTQLTPNDLRLAAFIRLNLSSKQIASLLNIAPSSVDISKYRLKKKLGLGKDDNIYDLIVKY